MTFNRHSTVREVLANEASRAVLGKYVPGASMHPNLPMAMDMTLAEVATYPESGLSEQGFKALVAELEKLPGT